MKNFISAVVVFLALGFATVNAATFPWIPAQYSHGHMIPSQPQ